MARPVTLLEDLCRHAVSCGADAMAVEHQDGCERVYGRIGDSAAPFASFRSSSNDAKELRENLHRAHKKPLRTVLAGQVYIVKVRIVDEFGEDAFEIKIEPAPKPGPNAVPRFTAKQGQYLAFLYHYTSVHRVAPSEVDIQRHFRVSAPSVHEMIKTLERNGLIERTPGKARSIRVLVKPEHLPPLT